MFLCRGDSNEYPQHMFLWRNKQNYPLIITKYPSYLFHLQTTGRRHNSIHSKDYFCQKLNKMKMSYKNDEIASQILNLATKITCGDLQNTKQ